MMDTGHRATVDGSRLQAWAPSRDECLAEAASALVEAFADTTSATATAEAQVWIEPADDDDQLARLLGEIIRRVTADAVLPVDVEVTEPQGGGLDVRLWMAPLRDARLTGRLPGRVSLPEVSLRRRAGHWLATFTVTAQEAPAPPG